MMERLLAKIYNNLRFMKVMQLLKNLKKRNIKDLEGNAAYQRNKLARILQSAFADVAYYKSLGVDFNPYDLNYQDFCKIPVLTKDIIRNNGDVLVNRNYVKIDQVMKTTSGGSTGEPLEFFKTKTQVLHGSAAYYYSLALNNVDMFEKSIDLWGAERDMHANKSKFNIRNVLHNKVTLNTFVLSEAIIKSHIRRINEVKPVFIKAYVHSIYDMAKYINKNSIKIKYKPVIQCTTGPLYPEMRSEIAKAFNNAHVYNFYGSREVSSIASEIYGSKGLFVFYDNLFLEILDENNEPVKEGEEGEVVVTTLNNFYMPLIRYKIGDRAVKGDSLEFGTLKLNKVVGRTLGVIYKSDGSKIDGQFFTTLFFNKPSIKSFQLVQHTIGLLELNIVKSNSFYSKELDEIVKRIKMELPNIMIDINFCEEINLTETGKIMYVYSNLDIP